jgi:hypothetical protein
MLVPKVIVVVPLSCCEIKYLWSCACRVAQLSRL